MQILNVTNLPIYLPLDKAPVPFGDPINGVSATVATPGIITIPDYAPTVNDAVSFSFQSGGSLPAPLVVGTTYYVQGSISGNGAAFSATKGGAAITTTTAGSLITAHLVSGETDGVVLPFKPGWTVVVENNTGGTLVLQGAADVNVAAPGTNTYNPPGGPGTWNTIVSVTANNRALAQLTYDWIRVSTAATLTLVQN